MRNPRRSRRSLEEDYDHHPPEMTPVQRIEMLTEVIRANRGWGGGWLYRMEMEREEWQAAIWAADQMIGERAWMLDEIIHDYKLAQIEVQE